MTDRIHRVLVVDADYDVRESIAEVLSDNDYEPIAAANGREALRLLQNDETRPCVILLDMMMPVMDGWQFRARLQSDADLSTIPVVVLTAHVPAPGEVVPMHFLKKPVKVEALLASIARFCPKL
jgi:CheY-like chemotaxis protein